MNWIRVIRTLSTYYIFALHFLISNLAGPSSISPTEHDDIMRNSIDSNACKLCHKMMNELPRMRIENFKATKRLMQQTKFMRKLNHALAQPERDSGTDGNDADKPETKCFREYWPHEQRLQFEEKLLAALNPMSHIDALQFMMDVQYLIKCCK